MEEILKKLAEHFGFAAPFGYAALAYGFFFWLDKEASDEAKAALARTMRFRDYKKEQVASALVEVFDRIYTYPLLRWRAFGRSLLFTTVVSAIWVIELLRDALRDTSGNVSVWLVLPLFSLYALPFSLLSALSDYLALFAIRPLLIRSGTKPVIGLGLGAVSGAAIILAVNVLRENVVRVVWHCDGCRSLLLWDYLVPNVKMVWPAMVVLAWLPLFALGILTARLLTPLSWVVGKTQWFLKEGKEHPLKAIGYVAAVVVFIGTVALRKVFSA
jgi:hypothetical protein